MNNLDEFDKQIFVRHRDCYAQEHIIHYEMDLSEKNIFVSYFISASYLTWWKRLIMGIKYIFGKRSRYGEFDTTIINRRKVIELRNFLNYFIEKTKEK